MMTEFNQDNSIEFDGDYRSPGWDRYKKIKFKMEKIDKLKKLFKKEEIDGYLIPKNDEFFGEYTPKYNDRLNFISDFTGSYGFALVLKDKNYLFVDGRYTLQANNRVENYLKLLQFQIKCQLYLKGKNYRLVLILIYLPKIIIYFFWKK